MYEIGVDVSFYNHITKKRKIQAVVGDYNVLKLVFIFDEDVSDSTIIFKMSNPDKQIVFEKILEDNSITLYDQDEEGHYHSLFTKAGLYAFEVIKKTSNSRITSAPGWLNVSSDLTDESGGGSEPPSFVEDGFSPTLDVVPIDGGYRITITDIDGEKPPVDILNGQDGAPGEKGDKGDKGDPGASGVTSYPELTDIPIVYADIEEGSEKRMIDFEPDILYGVKYSCALLNDDSSDSLQLSPGALFCYNEYGRFVVNTDGIYQFYGSDFYENWVDCILITGVEFYAVLSRLENKFMADEGITLTKTSQSIKIRTEDTQYIYIAADSDSIYRIPDNKIYVFTPTSSLYKITLSPVYGIDEVHHRHFIVDCTNFAPEIELPANWDCDGIRFDLGTIVEVDVLDNKAVFRIWD